MMHTVVHAASWGAALFLLVRGICTLNAMSRSSAWPFKAAKIALTLAAFFAVFSPLYSARDDAMIDELLIVCFALVLAFDRRSRSGEIGPAPRA